MGSHYGGIEFKNLQIVISYNPPCPSLPVDVTAVISEIVVEGFILVVVIIPSEEEIPLIELDVVTVYELLPIVVLPSLLSIVVLVGSSFFDEEDDVIVVDGIVLVDEVTVPLLLEDGVEVSPMRVVVILSLVLPRVVVSRELVVEEIPDEIVDVIVEEEERLEEGPVVEGVIIVEVNVVVVVSPLEGVEVDPIVEESVDEEDGMDVLTVVLDRLEVEGMLVDSDGVIVVRVVEGMVD